jgi:hypothetical protein
LRWIESRRGCDDGVRCGVARFLPAARADKPQSLDVPRNAVLFRIRIEMGMIFSLLLWREMDSPEGYVISQ